MEPIEVALGYLYLFTNKIIMRSLLFFIMFFLFTAVSAQKITGNLSQLSNKSIQLIGFNGLNTYQISTDFIDEKGDFQLYFTELDYGVAYLLSSDDNPLFVILKGENVEILGDYLGDLETLRIIKGEENQLFEQYALESPKRENALSAWSYLEKMYSKDSLFFIHDESYLLIQKEIKRIKEEDTQFLESLPSDSYIKWFLPLRKLISSVPLVAQHRPEEIWPTIKQLREINYNDDRLYKSGLYKDVLESNFWLIENSGKSLDSVYIEMKISIDSIIDKLLIDENKLNETTDFLFNLLERHSLFQASEYLALKVLNESSCTINNDLVMQLEAYRAMKKGNIAPEILFEDFTYLNGVKQKQFKSLANFTTKYTLVVFGASWCPKCLEEIPKLIQNYVKWRNMGLEVVYVSLDTEKHEFEEMVKSYPFFVYCDFQKWDSQVVQDYFVSGTPTFYLLNDKREIILRPTSIGQIDTWVDWFLVED